MFYVQHGQRNCCFLFFFWLFFFSLDILSRKIKELFSINSARARRDFSVWCCSSHSVKFRIWILSFLTLWNCVLFISDVTPPSTRNCPASFSDTSSNPQKQITWTAPTFTDNVGVTSVMANRQSGFTMATYTSVNIQYTATDAAGNMAYCKFNITLEGTWYSERSILTKTTQPRFLILLRHPFCVGSV